MAARLLSAALVGVILFTGTCALAIEPSPAPVQQLYLDDHTRTVVLLVKADDLKKEAAEFKDFRQKYALLWTGIIAALAAYAYTRNK